METLPIQSRKEFNQVINYAGDYINNWIHHELKNIYNRGLVFIQTDKNSYKINDILIHKENDVWTVEYDDKVVHSFINKTAAFFYCLLWYSGKLQMANTLLNLDRTLVNRVNDCELILTRLKNYHDDKIKKEIALARYYENVENINVVRQQLEKNLTLAKYIKFRKIL